MGSNDMIYKWLTPYLVLPLHDRITGQYAWRKTGELLRLQWLTFEQLRAGANAKLASLLKHAYQQVPYYKQIFDQAGIQPGDIKSVADLHRIPITKAETLKLNYDGAMLARSLPATRRDKRYTSGSSGLPHSLYVDRKAWPEDRASLLYFRCLAKIDPWDANLWLASPGHLRSAKAAPKSWYKLARRYLVGEIMQYTGGGNFDLLGLQKFIKRLPQKRDYFIFSFPSFLTRLIKQIDEQGGLKLKKPKAVLSYAQTMGPGLPGQVKQAFGCQVFDLYSAQEMLFMAMTCPDQPSLMHLNTERGWIRVVDAQGKDCQPGQCGRVVLTDFHNRVMPLINYDLGDLAVPGPPCACGRGFPTLQRVEGRTSESLRLRDGTMLASNTMAHVLLNKKEFLPYVWEYQAYQHRLNHIAFRIVPTAMFNNDIRRRMLRHLQDYFGPQVIIELEVTGSLPMDAASGKRPIIISRLP
jgi:phenylacetate-CoA ligase